MTTNGALDDDRFVQRLGEIKEQITNSLSDRWGDIWNSLVKKAYGDPVVADVDELMDFTDRFYLQHRLPSGMTPIEEYAATATDLADEERAALRRWTEPVETLFEILRIEGRRIDVRSIITGKEYPVRPNNDWSLDAFQPGWLLRARLVPVRNFYSLSGPSYRYPPERRRLALRKMQEAGIPLPAAYDRRWKPTADHPAPPPTAPCPCGSGRRYKKCCLRR